MAAPNLSISESVSTLAKDGPNGMPKSSDWYR